MGENKVKVYHIDGAKVSTKIAVEDIDDGFIVNTPKDFDCDYKYICHPNKNDLVYVSKDLVEWEPCFSVMKNGKELFLSEIYDAFGFKRGKVFKKVERKFKKANKTSRGV